MKRGALLAVVLLALAGLALWLIGDGGAPGPAPLVDESTVEDREAAPPLLGADGPPQEQPLEAPPVEVEALEAPEAVPREAAATRYTIQGRVEARDPGRPVPRGTVVATIRTFHVEEGNLRWKNKRLRALPDRAGRFSLEVIGSPAKAITDFAFEGGDLRVAGWTIADKGLGPVLDVRDGAENEVVLELVEVFRLQGVVVDERGRRQPHVSIEFGTRGAAHLAGAIATSRAHTDEDGRFDIGPFDAAPPKKDSPVRPTLMVAFLQPGSAITRLDPWSVPERERGDVRLVLDPGVALGGSLVGPDGHALPNVVVEVEYGKDWKLRRATRTDERGTWRIRGLSRGKARLRALAFAHRCKASREISLQKDNLRVDLVGEALPAIDPGKLHRVLGLSLAEVDEATRKAYELPEHVSILILEAHENHQRLGIGTLEPGYGLWMVGSEGASTLLEAVERMLALAKAGRGTVRVVYTFANERMRGTNTQHMRLSTKDREALEALAERLRDR